MSKNTVIIGIIGQKGGGGKSTAAINLAVAAAEKAQAAVVIDTDQQANVAKWKDRRKADNVAVVAAPASRINQTIHTAREHGADIVIVDSPGHNATAALETVRASELVILPVEAQMFHFETLPSMRDLIRIGGDTPTWVLINKLHPSASVQAEKLKKLLSQTYSMPVCPVHLTRLDVYATSADVGLAVLEQEPNGKAANDVRELYKFICKQVNKLRNKHVKDERLATGA
jgi:chromosome partitioning protein